MRLLIDGNILLDVLQKREPHVENSAKIWKLCETRQAEGYVSALTFANLAYIMRKELSPGQVNEVLRLLTLNMARLFNVEGSLLWLLTPFARRHRCCCSQAPPEGLIGKRL